MTLVAGALAILAAAFVKGAVAFGFPLVATPLLALVVGVKTAIAVSIIPNIVMDSVQLVRRGQARATVRRMLSLIVFSMVGMWLGTRLLVVLPGHIASIVLGVFVLLFAAVTSSGVALRVQLAGFAAGLRLQDWLPARAFNRAVLAFLVVIGVWLVVRSL